MFFAQFSWVNVGGGTGPLDGDVVPYDEEEEEAAALGSGDPVEEAGLPRGLREEKELELLSSPVAMVKEERGAESGDKGS